MTVDRSPDKPRYWPNWSNSTQGFRRGGGALSSRTSRVPLAGLNSCTKSRSHPKCFRLPTTGVARSFSPPLPSTTKRRKNQIALYDFLTLSIQLQPTHHPKKYAPTRIRTEVSPHSIFEKSRSTPLLWTLEPVQAPCRKSPPTFAADL